MIVLRHVTILFSENFYSLFFLERENPFLSNFKSLDFNIGYVYNTNQYGEHDFS